LPAGTHRPDHRKCAPVLPVTSYRRGRPRTGRGGRLEGHAILRDADELRRTLTRIDGRGYKAYKDIEGAYGFPGWTLYIDHVQGDPFAAPSRLRARVPASRAGFPSALFSNPARRVALEDYLTRAFDSAVQRAVKGHRGTGRSGLIAVDRPGQEILERTSAVVRSDWVEVRFVMGLPAAGRRVLGREAARMFFDELPMVVEASLLYRNLSAAAVARHVDAAEDQEHLRARLREMGLVAFVADGAVLPRESGVSDRPMRGPKVVRFRSPDGLRVTVQLPHAGQVTGMGIPEGVTLVVGGGYHGKSTLLRAIERGIYNHVPGDGRELVVTVPDAVKIRAEDGRRVEQVDISPFITNLPGGEDTRAFSTDQASGSTSQAANIVEALELGARLLLLDEDTSATNFMIRDRRMQELVAKDREPITPFLDRVRQLYEEKGVSTVLVVGGSGDYFDVADTVVMMDNYLPRDVTRRAKEIAGRFGRERRTEAAGPFGEVTPRCPVGSSLDPRRGRGDKVKIAVRDLDTITFGREEIDLSAVEQLVDPSQTRAVADALHYAARRYFDGRTTLREALERVMADIRSRGLGVISPFAGRDGEGHPGDYALPRVFELGAAVNRLRTLRVVQRPGPEPTAGPLRTPGRPSRPRGSGG